MDENTAAFWKRKYEAAMDELELWKSRYEAEKQAHEADMAWVEKHGREYLDY